MHKSTGRFGPRYGRTVKNKVAKIEKQAKKTYKCPYCMKVATKKEQAGIWSCSKCNKKFTARAYTISQ